MVKKEKDTIIGKKLRQLRNMRGISQSVLASETGITFQQIQKYEKGVNRISAGRLHDFAQIFGIDVKSFYSDLEDSANQKKYALAEGDAEKFITEDMVNSKESTMLLREYYKITDANKRKSIIEFIKAMSNGKK